MGEIKEEFTSQQPNDDWYKKWSDSYFNKEEKDLFDALSRQDLTKTKTLLKQVQNINVQANFCNIITGKSTLHYIVKNSCNNPGPCWIELLEEVLSKYSATNLTPAINVNIMSELDGMPLYVACKLGNLDVVNVILKYRADPNVYGFLYRPLHYALRENKIDIAKVFLKHRAETIGLKPSEIVKFSKSAVEVFLPYLSDEEKGRMLQSIAYSDHGETDHDIEIVKLLLNAGADLIVLSDTLTQKRKASL